LFLGAIWPNRRKRADFAMNPDNAFSSANIQRLDQTSDCPAEHPRRWPEIHTRALCGTIGEPADIQNSLSQDEQERILSIATVLDYPRGGLTVYSEGEDARFIYFMDQGMVRVSRYGENGRRQVLAFRVHGDLLGLPEGGLYANSAETVCAARVFQFPWEYMRQMMLAEPRIGMNLLAKVASEFRQAQKLIMILGQQNTHQRLASFILDCLHVSANFDENQPYLHLPVGRFDLADYLGTAPESTARAFVKLESAGLVRRVGSRTIEILDIPGLQLLQCEQRRGPSPRPPKQTQPSSHSNTHRVTECVSP
jgi:CRP-like cAMP-binding protein